MLLPRLPLLADQAAGDGRGHGGPGNGSRGGRDRSKGSLGHWRGKGAVQTAARPEGSRGRGGLEGLGTEVRVLSVH